jgi:hypothetical protein
MATASTVADYVTRRADLLILQGDYLGRPSQQMAQAVADGDGVSYVVAGVQKLAQKFFKLLFTRRGSVAYLPDYGTLFLGDARSGRWRTSADVYQSFHSALLDAGRQLVADEAAGDPDDERFRSAELRNVQLLGDLVRLRVFLLTQAGTGYTFLTPIPVLVH